MARRHRAPTRRPQRHRPRCRPLEACERLPSWHPAMPWRRPPPSSERVPARTTPTSIVDQIVEPARAFHVAAREDAADSIGILVLVIAQVNAIVGGHIQDLDLAGPVRHDVAERLLNAAQT